MGKNSSKNRDALLSYYATHPKVSVGVACNFPVPIDFEFATQKIFSSFDTFRILIEIFQDEDNYCYSERFNWTECRIKTEGLADENPGDKEPVDRR